MTETRTWYRGASDDQPLRPNADGVVWLADSAAARTYGDEYWHKGPRGFLWTVVLKPGARIVRLDDLSNKTVRELKDNVSELRASTWGPISDADWPSFADFGILEAYPWAVRKLRARFDGVIVRDANHNVKHESLALLRMGAIMSMSVEPFERGQREGLGEGAVPSWLANAKAGQRFKGPNGNEVLGYEWRWLHGEKHSDYEGGLVGAKVSDWDRAEKCKTCDRAIVHLYWVRDKDTGEMHPYGADHLHLALGYSRELDKTAQDRIRKKVLNHDSAAAAEKAREDHVLKVARVGSVDFVPGAVDNMPRAMIALTKRENLVGRGLPAGMLPLFFMHPSTKRALAILDAVAEWYAPVLKREGWIGPMKGGEFSRLAQTKENVGVREGFSWEDRESSLPVVSPFKPSTVWYHATSEAMSGATRPLYLSLESLEGYHGQHVYTFIIDPKAVWGDIDKGGSWQNGSWMGGARGAGMDSVGYRPDVVKALSEAGFDVLWDRHDFRTIQQVFVTNPKMLKRVGYRSGKKESVHQVPVGVLLSEAAPKIDSMQVNTDGECDVRGMLGHMGDLAKIGHSFSVVVDPDDAEYRRTFSVDGDGGDRVRVIDELKERAGPDGWVDLLDERAKPPKAECRVCGKRITVNKDGTLGSHLRDVEGRRIHCPGSGSKVSAPVSEAYDRDGAHRSILRALTNWKQMGPKTEGELIKHAKKELGLSPSDTKRALRELLASGEVVGEVETHDQRRAPGWTRKVARYRLAEAPLHRPRWSPEVIARVQAAFGVTLATGLDEAPPPKKPKPPAGAKRALKLVNITNKGEEKEQGEVERHRASLVKIRQNTDDAKRKALLTTEARERMIVEAAMKVSDLLPNIGIQVARQPNQSIRVSYWHLGADRRAFKKQRDKIEGYILMAKETMMAKDIGACSDAYMVQWAGATKGWGPLLYDVAVEVATKLGGGLMADRHSVSPDAHAVWAYYVSRRPDVKVHQLDTTADAPETKLTPRDPSDDCDQDTAKEYAGKGHEEDWWAQPEAKRITKENPTTLRALADAGRLVLHRFEPSAFGVTLAPV